MGGVPSGARAVGFPMNTKRKRSFLAYMRTSPYLGALWPMLGVLPLVIVLLLFSVYPAILNVVMSFTNYNGIWSQAEFVGMKNYVNFWTVLGSDVLPSFWVTIKYCLMLVLPLQVLALGAALLVNMKFRGSNFFRAVYFMPSILGSAVVCAAWKLLYDPNIGPFAQFLELFGKSSAFLGDSDISLICIVVIGLWSSYGYAMTIYLAGLQGVSRDYYEAASIDGAGAWTTFRRITLPLIWPTVTINLWIAISGALGMSDIIMLTTKGGYGTRTIGYYIFDTVINNTMNKGQAAAVAIYYFIFITTIMLLFNFLVRKREVSM